MELIRELNARVANPDPIQKAIAAMDNQAGGVDEFVARFGGELQGLDRESAAEMIGDILENDPAHQYGPESADFIAAVLHKLGM